MTRTEHLLAIVSEECDEVSQRAIKALRFGLAEVQPGQDKTNAERVVIELADLIGVVEMLQDEGLLPRVERRRCDDKKAKVEHYLKYSESLGTCSP